MLHSQGSFGQSYLLSELILLNKLFELLSQLHVLLPQLGVVGAMLFHLHFDIAQGHLEVQHGLLSLLLILPGALGVFLLSGDRRSGNERRSTRTLREERRGKYVLSPLATTEIILAEERRALDCQFKNGASLSEAAGEFIQSFFFLIHLKKFLKPCFRSVMV